MPKVSIIIPTYNREHLIVDTIKSILKQTHENWECIIIDDSSNDNTIDVLKQYTPDKRIVWYKRPEEVQKGANSCRNIGFQKSSGDYIIWFDSDDLMTPDHIEKKVKALLETNTDFIIGRTQNFKGEEMLKPYTYEKKKYGIKASDFILLKIHWYTYDVLLKREIANQISWNEQMKSWQDYNYFCKMLLITENGAYLDKILTYRRIHHGSIQSVLTQTPENFKIELLQNRLLTFQDIREKIDLNTKRELIFGMMNLSFEIMLIKSSSSDIEIVKKIVRKEFGLRSKFFFTLSLIAGKLIHKGHFLLNKAKNR